MATEVFMVVDVNNEPFLIIKEVAFEDYRERKYSFYTRVNGQKIQFKASLTTVLDEEEANTDVLKEFFEKEFIAEITKELDNCSNRG